jgi:flagellar protein FliO/FliZ
MMRRFVIAGALAALALASTFAPLAALAQQDAASPAAAPAAAAPAPAPALPAASATAPATSASPMAGPSAGNLMQTIFALLFVLALLAVLAWILKRYGPKAHGGNANIHLVGALNLGGRERIIVVEVGDQWIVVGASPGRVNALATMPKQQAAASATLHPQQPAASSFGEWLKQTIDKRNAN